MDVTLTLVKDSMGHVVLLVLEGRMVGWGGGIAPGDNLERERPARITLDSMVQFVGLLDAKGTVLEINHVALDAGIKLGDVEGKLFWETLWWQVSPAINAHEREIAKQREKLAQLDQVKTQF